MKTLLKKYKTQFRILLLATILLNLILIVSAYYSDALFRDIKNREDALYYMYLTLVSLGSTNSYPTNSWEYFTIIFIALSGYLFLIITLAILLIETYKKTKKFHHYIKNRKINKGISRQ